MTEAEGMHPTPRPRRPTGPKAARRAPPALVLACAALSALAGTERDVRDPPADFAVEGRGTNAQFAVDRLGDGTRMAAGDVNGDGVTDLVVGASATEPFEPQDSSGAVHVFFGPLSSPVRLLLDQDPADLTIWGPSRGSFLGQGIAVGDVDGDGIDDIVAGAPGFAGDPEGREAAHVLLGRRSWPAEIFLAATPADVTVRAGVAGGDLGAGAAAGDLDGDGRDEVILAEGGRLHVLRGRAAWPPTMDLAAAPADTVIGPLTARRMAVGDVSGDGLADLVTADAVAAGPDGSRRYSGTVTIFFGRSEWPDRLDLESDPPDVTVHGPAEFARLGSAIDVADLDGDATADLVMGARGLEDPSGARRGGVIVLRGTTTWPAVVDLAVDAPDLLVRGREPGGYFGSAVAVGDADGDGRPDLLVGASFAREQAGEACLLLGRDAWPPLLDLAAEEPAFIVHGPASGNRIQLGKAALLADVGGDAAADLLLGSIGDDGTFAHGEAHVLFGTPTFRLSCDPGGPYVACGEPSLTLDASSSAGPDPFSLEWRALTPGLAIGDVTAARTTATLSGVGPFDVELVVRSGLLERTCRTRVHADDTFPPVLDCERTHVVEPTEPVGAIFSVPATVSDDCDPQPELFPDFRTQALPNEPAFFPCGVTSLLFRAEDDAGRSTACLVDVVVANAEPPAELSGPGSVPLRVARTSGGLILSFDDRSGGRELVNAYGGTLSRDGFRHDHVPLACHEAFVGSGAGTATLDLADVPGDAYFLVSSSNCRDESARGRSSAGVDAPALPGDCGAVR